MRVTHVITRLIVGGAQENTVSSVLGLRRIPGLEVDLISGPTTGPEGSIESTLEPGVLTVLPQLVRPISPLNDCRAYFQLTRLFRQTRPTIVHTHSGKAGIIGRLAAHKAGVPVIIHTIHGPSFGPFQNAAANLLFTAAERAAGRVTHRFITVAEAMTRQYLAAGIGEAGQYSRVFSGFPLEPYLNATNDLDLRARLGLAPEDFVVGTIARLFALKGHDDLIAAAPEIVRQCPSIKFLLVGDGTWRERLQNKINQLGLAKRFVFAGLVPPAEVPRYVGIMDALVHLSRREGLPRALPQAMAAAKPIVAFDCDGAREVCLDDQTGYLAPLGDVAAIETRIAALYHNPALCARLGQAGREFVRERFSVERMVRDILAVYQSAVPAATTEGKRFE
jgi:glycosyltransferase involved in cell wall biosynthesis